MQKNCLCKCNCVVEKGEYVCCNCGTHLELEQNTMLPPCPTCGNGTFKKND